MERLEQMERHLSVLARSAHWKLITRKEMDCGATVVVYAGQIPGIYRAYLISDASAYTYDEEESMQQESARFVEILINVENLPALRTILDTIEENLG